MTTPLDYYRAFCLVLPQEPENSEVLFVPGRALHDWEPTEGDQGILVRAKEVLRDGCVQKIVLNGAGANFGPDGLPIPTSWPGCDRWIEELCRLEVDDESIVRTAGSQNTGDECDEFVRLAQHEGWSTALVLVNPHQVLRTMLTFLRSFRVVGYTLRSRPIAPRWWSWTKVVYGSQGRGPFPRHEHIQLELDLIPGYIERGWLGTLEELEQYLLKK